MFEETLVAADESLEMIVKHAAPVVCAILKYVVLPVLCVCLNEGLQSLKIIEMDVWFARNLSHSHT